MNKNEYIKSCEKLLTDNEFYENIATDINLNLAENLQIEIDKLKEKKNISSKEYKFLCEDLPKPRTPVFYGLPKIHKMFTSMPPLRPIVSGYQSCTYNLSVFLDSFLKYQAQRCSSYIRDTKDFLNKINEISKNNSFSSETILVTLDVASLYTNIDHEEGAKACFKKLQTRKYKSISSGTLKDLILLVLRSNVFRFGLSFYKQIKGTPMGTPFAPNYANLF